MHAVRSYRGIVELLMNLTFLACWESSSIVIQLCYAFHKIILERFLGAPQNVRMDMKVTLEVNLGFRVSNQFASFLEVYLILEVLSLTLVSWLQPRSWIYKLLLELSERVALNKLGFLRFLHKFYKFIISH